MKEIHIRRVQQSEDIHSVILQCDSGFQEPVAQRQGYPALLEKLSRYALVFAEGTTQCRGYAAMYANDMQTKTAFLSLLAVTPAYQGMGIARALLAHCEAAAIACGMERITLEVRKENIPARSLYEQQGFIPTGKETCGKLFMTKPLAYK